MTTTPPRPRWEAATAEDIQLGGTLCISVPDRSSPGFNSLIPGMVTSVLIDANGVVDGAEMLYLTKDENLKTIEVPVIALRILK